MDLTDISNLRLFNQQICESRFKTVKELVGWMGALQAQDYNMVKWALGSRLPVATEKVIESAIDKGEIIRTHLLRPTWHFVSAADIYWMLKLTAPRIEAAMKPRDIELGLTEKIYNKSNSLLVKVLANNNHSTREELMEEMTNARIATDNNRASHLFMRAELHGIICSGKHKNKRQTYALLSERVPQTAVLTRNEALALLAKKYFMSHGPATLNDFIWWSGLSAADSRSAFEMAKSEFVSETIDNRTFWFSPTAVPVAHKDTVFLLPAFDEFIISYKDRSASLPFMDHVKAVSNNGIFRPIIVKNGQVIGTWKRTIKADTVLFETTYFRPVSKLIAAVTEKLFIEYASFINKQADFKTL